MRIPQRPFIITAVVATIVILIVFVGRLYLADELSHEDDAVAKATLRTQGGSRRETDEASTTHATRDVASQVRAVMEACRYLSAQGKANAKVAAVMADAVGRQAAPPPPPLQDNPEAAAPMSARSSARLRRDSSMRSMRSRGRHRRMNPEEDAPGEGIATLPAIGSVPVAPVGGNANCSGMQTNYPVVPYDVFLRTTVVSADYAYVTYITSPDYVRLAITMLHSLAATGSHYSRCVLVTRRIKEADRRILTLYAQVIEIDDIPSPMDIEDKQYLDVFTKLRIWQLEPLFRKIIYLDADIVLRRNIDELFDIPVGEEGLEWAIAKDGEAPPNRITKVRRTNTGLMVVRPSLALFDEMIVSLGRDLKKKMLLLPDLLFLVNFFDVVYPAVLLKNNTPVTAYRPITALIPRWYHVFHRQFYTRDNFMTMGRQHLTIFDERIKSVHFAGKSKPWHNDFSDGFQEASVAPDEGVFEYRKAMLAPFSRATESHVATKMQRYSTAFCSWREYVRLNHVTLNVRRVLKTDYDGIGYGNAVGEKSQRRKLGDIRRAVAPPPGVNASSEFSAVSPSEMNYRVEPFLSAPGFLWYLHYAMALQFYSWSYNTRCAKNMSYAYSAGEKACDDIGLDKRAAADFRRVIADHHRRSPVNPSVASTNDLYEAMAASFDRVPSGDVFDFMFRHQLLLGEAWGFNAEYAKRSEGSRGLFTPLTLMGTKLTKIIEEWNQRN